VRFALHGFTATPAMWQDVRMDGPALLGHGPQSPAQGEESFASEVERLASLLPDASVDLVGYSLGARLSLALALAHPTRIRRLSLIGVTPGIEDEKARGLRVASDAVWSAKLRNEGITAFVDAWQALTLWNTQAKVSDARREALRRERLSHDPEQLARAMDALGTGSMPSMWPALPTLTMPVQVIAGALDTKYAAIAARMCQMLPNASLHLIPGAGHNPVFEDPQRVYNVLNEAV